MRSNLNHQSSLTVRTKGYWVEYTAGTLRICYLPTVCFETYTHLLLTTLFRSNIKIGKTFPCANLIRFIWDPCYYIANSIHWIYHGNKKKNVDIIMIFIILWIRCNSEIERKKRSVAQMFLIQIKRFTGIS